MNRRLEERKSDSVLRRLSGERQGLAHAAEEGGLSVNRLGAGVRQRHGRRHVLDRDRDQLRDGTGENCVGDCDGDQTRDRDRLRQQLQDCEAGCRAAWQFARQYGCHMHVAV